MQPRGTHKRDLQHRFLTFVMCVKVHRFPMCKDIRRLVWKIYFQQSMNERRHQFVIHVVSPIYNNLHMSITSMFHPIARNEVQIGLNKLIPLFEWDNVPVGTFNALVFFLSKNAGASVSRHFDYYNYPTAELRISSIQRVLTCIWNDINNKINNKIKKEF